ncbi:unnamed protein product [Effrenium voratum]|uniref:Uncharacterized protein n=1 Tax=Effrenium voratum TaxID=2562239 RepID=A0AA36MSH7_9DINO|nr:unnamed protein product [Effrenium voratum]
MLKSKSVICLVAIGATNKAAQALNNWLDTFGSDLRCGKPFYPIAEPRRSSSQKSGTVLVTHLTGCEAKRLRPKRATSVGCWHFRKTASSPYSTVPEEAMTLGLHTSLGTLRKKDRNASLSKGPRNNGMNMI